MPHQRNEMSPSGQPAKGETSTQDEQPYDTPARRQESDSTVKAAAAPAASERDSSTPTDSRLPAETESKRDETRVRPPAIQSLGDLLRTVYGRKRRSLTLKKTEIAAICSAPKVEAVAREELLGLATSDRTLE